MTKTHITEENFEFVLGYKSPLLPHFTIWIHALQGGAREYVELIFDKEECVVEEGTDA